MGIAIGSHGTLLKFNGTTIAEVVDIDGPSMSRAMHETPNQTDNWKEYVAGIADAGAVSFGIHYVPTEGTHDASTGLLYAFENATEDTYTMVWPDTGGTTWSFTGYLSEFSPSAPADGVLDASCTVTISGSMTIV